MKRQMKSRTVAELGIEVVADEITGRDELAITATYPFQCVRNEHMALLFPFKKKGLYYR